MKTFQASLWFILVSLFLFFACSKDADHTISTDSEELIHLSLNLNILDLKKMAITKQEATNFPACSTDDPFYIEIILSQGDTELVGDPSEPFRIDLVSDQLFTKDVPEMKLPPGQYFLDYCAVYSESGSLLCMAPMADSPMAVFSEATMPLSINLAAGSKPFPDIPVVCYDNRDLNQFGYALFDLQPVIMRQFCFFANYCSDNGRHYPAKYSVNITMGDKTLFSEEINKTGKEDHGTYFADPLCFTLPDVTSYDLDEEYIDFTLKLLAWDEVYPLDQKVEIKGSLSRADIIANLSGQSNVAYEHFFFNCDNN